MADHVIPHFQNDAGVAAINIGVRPTVETA